MKLKKYLVLFLLFSGITNVLPQENHYAIYFDEIREAAKDAYQLWDKDLYSAILLVDPQTRKIYANESDPEGELKLNVNYYEGTLPEEINIANTSIQFNGKEWAMLILPLPENKASRINLLAHELFHKAQKELGFELYNVSNDHLNEKNGRVFLRLELEAVKAAINASSINEMKTLLTDAMIFRKYRHDIFPEADSTENLLELNEGIAEYTGFFVSGISDSGAIDHFNTSINNFLKNPTYVRSFAYHTTPAYGFLLSRQNKFWNKEITAKTDLTKYFLNAFNISLPADFDITEIAEKYNGDIIAAEENKREEETNKKIEFYKNKFLEQPHFEIKLEQMSISFNPGNLFPLEDKGTVYPDMRVTDNWGILTVKNGALMSRGWDKIFVSYPEEINEKTISGDGWTLELKSGYSIIKDEEGNFKIQKEE